MHFFDIVQISGDILTYFYIWGGYMKVLHLFIYSNTALYIGIRRLKTKNRDGLLALKDSFVNLSSIDTAE